MTQDLDTEIPEYLVAPEVQEVMKLAVECARLNADITLQSDGGSDVQAAITAFYLTHEHHGAVLELLASGRLGSALAVLRPCFEALLTGLWLCRAIVPEQLQLYWDGKLTPSAEAMLRNLKKRPKNKEDAFLETTWNLSKRSLNQYAHCSFQLLARRSQGALAEEEVSSDEVANVIRFATGTAMLATVELARMGEHRKLEQLAFRCLGRLYPEEHDIGT